MTSTGVCLIIENNKGEILLMLRDDDKNLSYPNQWITLGGKIEPGETPEEAIKREMMEEIELDLQDFRLFKFYNRPHHKEYVYYTKLDLDPSITPLHEGQKIAYFSPTDISQMDLAYSDNEILRDYFSHDTVHSA